MPAPQGRPLRHPSRNLLFLGGGGTFLSCLSPFLVCQNLVCSPSHVCKAGLMHTASRASDVPSKRWLSSKTLPAPVCAEPLAGSLRFHFSHVCAVAAISARAASASSFASARPWRRLCMRCRVVGLAMSARAHCRQQDLVMFALDIFGMMSLYDTCCAVIMMMY